MSDLPWLTVLGLLPLAGAAVIALLPRGRDLLAKQVALVTSLLTLAATIAMCAAFDADGARFQFVEQHDWIPAFGIQYALGVDGIALVLVALTAVLVPVVVLASWYDADPQADARSAALAAPVTASTSVTATAGSSGTGGGTAVLDPPATTDVPPAGDPAPKRSVKTFFALLLVLETMLIGVFAATDVFLFYVFFEAMLIPMFFLIGSFGGPRRSYAAMKFLLYSLFGGLLMLVSVIGLYVLSAREGEGTFSFEALVGLEMSTGTEIALFLGFFIAFAIKAPLFPFHTWLPDAAAEAPIGTSVLLVAVMDKVGTFGFLRYCLPLFPEASRILGPYVIVLCVIGVLYGSLLVMGQRDMKRLVAYTSIAHFGFIGLGIFAFTSQAQTGATLYMVNHGLSTGALFLVVGFLVVRGRSRELGHYSGLAKLAPVLAGVFLVTAMSTLALPGLSTFVSEFLVLIGTYTRYPVAAVLATLGVILAALYILLMFQRTMQGELRLPGGRSLVPDLNGRELLTVAPLIALMVVLGFWPRPLTDVITPAVDAVMQDAGVTDPEPTLGHGGTAAAPTR